jgi:LuxR family maltose regulon positive regulatory protein
MTLALLTSKLSVPPLRSATVARPRLTSQLSIDPDQRLTLISAPAGFGKTTLLSEWIHRHPRSEPGAGVAWISLEKCDNDQRRFWTYFFSAFQGLDRALTDEALTQLQSPSPPPIESVLTTFVNNVTAHHAGSNGNEPYILVLDDYHTIDTPRIHEGIAFLVEHMPPQLHLVISSRTDPPLQLTRLRARNQLVELRAADLRFTAKETIAFIRRSMSLDLSEDEISVLEARTEGWIAGLQLAALSLQGKDKQHIGHFISALSGNNHYILDYLLEEVLEQQTADVQAFLLQTSILDRLSGPLCDAVVGEQNGLAAQVVDGQTMLERLERANLFIIPQDSERRWYRFHHLFADLLRGRLEHLHLDLCPALHKRAGTWYAENDFIAEALNHALITGDIDEVTRLVKQDVLALLEYDALGTLAKWLNALPEEVVRSRPWLSIAHAWVLTYAGQMEHTETLLEDMSDSLDELAEPTEEQHLLGHLSALRAYQAALRGDFPRAISSAREALDHLPESDVSTRIVTTIQLSYALRITGQFEASADLLNTVQGNVYEDGGQIAVSFLCEKASAYYLEGRLHRAYETYQKALRISDRAIRQLGRPSPGVGCIYAGMSTLKLEWHELEEALDLAQRGVNLCKQWGLAESLTDSYLYLAMVLQATGDYDGAMDAIKDAEKIATTLSDWYVKHAKAYKARLCVLNGDVEAAWQWAQEEGLHEDDNFTRRTSYFYVVLAYIYIAQQKPDNALKILDKALPLVEEIESESAMIRTLAAQAVALQLQGERERALTALSKALYLARRERYVNMFILLGREMEKLLKLALSRGIEPDYVGALLNAFRSTSSSHPLSINDRLIEPLSDRELEVLHLLSNGSSNKEIAGTLFITVSTVKNHLQNIYGKLAVNSRTQAVAEARELGLLDPKIAHQ